MEVHANNRPGQPYLGTGECVQGPTGDATGVRLRELPYTSRRFKAAIDA